MEERLVMKNQHLNGSVIHVHFIHHQNQKYVKHVKHLENSI